MPVLVTSNFDDDSIKNERASMETAFSHYNSTRNSNSSEILCMSSLPASIKRIGSKTTEKRWRHCFPLYKSMGALCCHGNHSFDPNCPKTLCSLFPTPVMLHIKFDQDWPTAFRDIQVWKCGRRTTTDDEPLVYYKLTLWDFSSGELKMWFYHRVKHPKDADGMANSVDAKQSDLGLHCLPRPMSENFGSVRMV